MSFLNIIIPFIILISIVVFVHEYGHYYYARKYGVKVTDFSIGFGKELFGWTDKYGTRWKLCLIPLGGYVKFFGDMNPASQPDQLSKFSDEEKTYLLSTKKLYQRAIIVSAGPIANFILALVIFACVYMFFGKDFSVPVIQDVKVDSPAYKAGLKKGDQIIIINDKTISSITEVSQSITLSDTNLIKITVLRDKREFDFQVQAIVQEGKDNLGNNINRKMIGIQIVPLNNEISRERLGPSKAIYHSLKEIWFTISTTMSYVGKMIVGTEKADQLGGPIKIAQISGQVAELGIIPFLSIMAYISISLGLINLFPIPLLDGGHLLFYFYEFVRGKPLSEKMQTYFFKFGLFILLSLMFFSTYNDLKGLGLF
ncbi:COG0750 Predicted membrane-associated Zn-dependent proteases 1 [Candidatus Pelagibacterales bacterium]